MHRTEADQELGCDDHLHTIMKIITFNLTFPHTLTINILYGWLDSRFVPWQSSASKQTSGDSKPQSWLLDYSYQESQYFFYQLFTLKIEWGQVHGLHVENPESWHSMSPGSCYGWLHVCLDFTQSLFDFLHLCHLRLHLIRTRGKGTQFNFGSNPRMSHKCLYMRGSTVGLLLANSNVGTRVI